MKTVFSSRLAAATAAGALLTMVFVSGCQTAPAPAAHPDDSTIHHPPGGPADVSKDGPSYRHRRRHHHHHPLMQGSAPGPVGEPAPITHPGG